jgi:hypothetical protein
MRDRRGLVVALAVLAAVNLAVLTSAWGNRAGTPGATVWLDERELEIVRNDAREDSSVTLRWRIADSPAYANPPWIERGWLDSGTLAAIGFDVSIAPGDPRAPGHYRSQLPRKAYVAFAVGGTEWAAFLQRVRERADARLRDLGSEPGHESVLLRELAGSAARRVSRLVPVAAGLDPTALRERTRAHPELMILPAVIRVWREEGRAGGPTVRGTLSNLLPRELNVPRDLRIALDRLAPPRGQQYRYVDGVPTLGADSRFSALVRVGAHGEPFVVAVSGPRP